MATQYLQRHCEMGGSIGRQVVTVDGVHRFRNQPERTPVRSCTTLVLKLTHGRHHPGAA
ncbi:hypothetical protein [Sphingomonas sp. F9_3S_D5_B_2]